MASAFTRGFVEEQNRLYIFKDTSEGTLARFIEWAYTGDYPVVVSAAEPGETSTKETEPVVKEKNTVTTAGTDLTFESHPLLAHVHLYIFCSIYSIPDLQHLTFSKMAARFMDLKKPNDPDTQVAVISTLRVSFGNLPTHTQRMILFWTGLLSMPRIPLISCEHKDLFVISWNALQC